MPKKRSASSSVSSPKAKKKKQSSMTGFFARTNPPEEVTDDGYTIFCDLDGVLCDFVAGVKKICNGKGPDELHNKGSMWSRIANTEDFYCNLPWMQDGRALWDAIRHLQPNILTGVPRSGNARQDKATWCRRELGVEINHVDMAGSKSTHCIVRGRKKKNVVNVITCWSKNKHLESGHRAYVLYARGICEEQVFDAAKLSAHCHVCRLSTPLTAF
jgi:hypothetical protein